MILGIKKKQALKDLAQFGTSARRDMHPNVLIGNYPPSHPVFKEGDILDANATLNLVLQNKGRCCNSDDSNIDSEEIATMIAKAISEAGLKGEKGDKGDKGDKGETGERGEQGLTGDPFTYEDFTEELLEALKGPKGEPGERGLTGELGEQGAPGRDGTDGQDGVTPHIDSQSGHWFIGDTDTGVRALGAEGQAGHDFTYEDFTPQQLAALKGPKGDDGSDGVSPTIGMNGNWFIGSTDTQVKARGNDGITPLIRINPTTLEWEVSTNGGTSYTSTGVVAEGPKGDTGLQGALGIQGERGLQGILGPAGPTGAQGPKGDTGDPFSIYKSYPSISDMNSDAGNVAENKFVIISNSDPSYTDNGKLYMKTSSGFNYISTLSGAAGIKGDKGDKGDPGDTGPLGLQGETGAKGDLGIQGILGPKGDKGDKGDNGLLGAKGDDGIGIKSVVLTTTSTDNGGINVLTVTLDDDRTALFQVRNGNAETVDSYTKSEIDDIVDQIQGQVSSIHGNMTLVAAGSIEEPLYLAYVSMDETNAKKVTHISFTWENDETGVIYGNNMQYYEEATFGDLVLRNVWCTPILTTLPTSVTYTAFIYGNVMAPISSNRYNHAFMQLSEYLALNEPDDNTIYFLWGDPEESHFPAEFPIVLG